MESLQATGFETLITALYFPGDPYLTSDAVFGVKQSLIEVSGRLSEGKEVWSERLMVSSLT